MPIEVGVRVYRGRRGLVELDELWRGLADEMLDRSPIHAYEWHRSFIETQEPEPEATMFVAVFTDGSLQAILPLRPVRKRLAIFGRRGLEVPTNPHVPFTDIVVGDPARLRAVMPSVLRSLASEPGVSWDYVLLRRTLPDSCAARCLRDIAGFTGWVCESGIFHHHPVRSYCALLDALSRKSRKNLRRAQRQAETLGNVTYHTARSREECELLFPEFLHVEASGWKGENGTRTAIALDSGLRRFYETLMQRFADRGQCRITAVRHEGRPIAAGFDLVMDRTQYGLKVGFDESYGQIAPGILLHWYILRTACEDPRLETYNLILRLEVAITLATPRRRAARYRGIPARTCGPHRQR